MSIMMNTRAVQITHDARGTRYRLLVVEDAQGGLQVVWSDLDWTGWVDAYPGSKIRGCGIRRVGGPTTVDLEIINEMLDTVREAWKRS